MKRCNIILVLITCFCCTQSYSQWFIKPATWSITDLEVETELMSTVASVGGEAYFVNKQKESFRKLDDLEREYNNKRQGFTDFKTNGLGVAIVASLQLTKGMIDDLQKEIDDIRAGTFFFKYGIDDIEYRLANESKYLGEIREDYDYMFATAIVGGGAGYTYQIFMKILIRNMDVRRNLMLIERELENLNTNNEIFIKN